ncbi:unnamed protein product [Prunus brigantina]
MVNARLRAEYQQMPQAEGSKRQRKLATADEPSSVPIVPAAKVAGIKPPRTWRPRKDGDLRRKGAVSAEPTATAPGKTDVGIHKDHSAVDLYGLTPENREIVELALKNTKAEGLITRGSDSAIKARKLEDKAPFGGSDLEYLRQYFSVIPVDTLFGLTTEERARASRLDDYLMARDALAEVRRALGREAESSNPPETKAAAHRAPGSARPLVKGRSDPFFGHEAEDDLPLGISEEEYEGVLGTAEERTLAGSGLGAERGQTDGLDDKGGVIGLG